MIIRPIEDTPTPRADQQMLVLQNGEIRSMDANRKVRRIRPEAGTPVHGVAATATIDPTGTNNSVLYTAKVAGVPGNSISVQYVISGAGSAVLSVVTSYGAIVVTAGSATVASAVITAVNAATASALVTAAASGTVTGTIAAVAATFLAGGVDATPGSQGDQLIDGNFLYTATADVTPTSTSGWEKSAVASL